MVVSPSSASMAGGTGRLANLNSLASRAEARPARAARARIEDFTMATISHEIEPWREIRTTREITDIYVLFHIDRTGVSYLGHGGMEATPGRGQSSSTMPWIIEWGMVSLSRGSYAMHSAVIAGSIFSAVQYYHR
jgi:hypothetical protein